MIEALAHDPVVDLGDDIERQGRDQGNERSIASLRLRLVPQVDFHHMKHSVSPFVYVNADPFHPSSPPPQATRTDVCPFSIDIVLVLDANHYPH